MIYDVTVPQFTKMLRNFSSILDKAAAHAQTKNFDVDVLLLARLAPDQFHFTRQVQIFCDMAKKAAERLSGKEAPVHEDNEKTWSELHARISSVLAYLESFSPEDFADAAQRRVTQPRWEGRWLTGEEFVIQQLLPNFYFHVTTAYAILRHNGVDVGKRDYLGPMPFKS